MIENWSPTHSAREVDPWLTVEADKPHSAVAKLRQQIRDAFSINSDSAPPAPEIPKSPESDRDYQSVIFGHSFRGFDRDQLITYYLALKVGAISPDTPVSFNLQPPKDDLANDKVMVVEPYLQPQDPLKKTQLGNFATGAKDEPAAVSFRQRYSREITALEGAAGQKLIELVAWLESMDSDKRPKKPPAFLKNDKMKLLTEIFHGYKLTTEKPAELLPQLVQALDDLLDEAQSRESLTEKYSEQIQAADAKAQADVRALQERARDPRFLKRATTLTGLKLAYFDVRGLGADSGGMTVAAEQTGADLIVLVDEVLSDGQPPEQIGTQFVIRSKQPGAQLEAELADRLQLSEALFGKGLLAGRFGGHPGVIASPPEAGSGLEPENLWIALQRHYNCPRYTKAEFEEKARHLAQEVGTQNVYPFIDVVQSDRATLAEWQMAMTLPTDSHPRVIKLAESDLAWYEVLLTDNVARNQQLLLQKTEVSEPDEVSSLRSTERGKQLEQMVNEKQTLQVLLLLDDLNLTSVEALSKTLKAKIISLIANSDDAIKLLWDQEASVFQITQNIPDWIENDLDTYHAARFRYLSVPMKVHRMVEALSMPLPIKIGEELSPEQVTAESVSKSALVSDLFKVLFSGSYLESHRREGFDDLFEMFIMAMANSGLSADEVKGKLSRLEQLYVADMNVLWRQVSYQTYTSFNTKYPKLLGFSEDDEKELFRPNKFLIIKPPTAETINPSAPVQTIFVEIGRSVRDTLTSRGIKLEASNGLGEEMGTVSDFAGEVLATNRALRFDENYKDHVVLAREIRKQVISMADLASRSKIRIVMGSFSNFVTSEMIPIIPMELWDRVILCQFNQQTGTFVDGKTLGQKLREAENE